MRKEFTREDATKESMSMRVEEKNLGTEFWESLTTGTGPLVAGALPSLDVQQESAMAEALTGGASKAKKRTQPKDDDAVEVKPATVKENIVCQSIVFSFGFLTSKSSISDPFFRSGLRTVQNKNHCFGETIEEKLGIQQPFPSFTQPRKAEDCKEDILREGGEARRYAVSLKGLSYGDKLVGELFAHSTKMEKMYESISNLLAAGSNNDEKYTKFMNLYKEQSQWFEKAKAFGQKTMRCFALDKT